MPDKIIYKAGAMGKLPTKAPCVECPLRKDSNPGALGGYHVRQYLEILHGRVDIACHLSKGFDTQNPELQRSCTGVAAYRAQMGLHHPPKSHIERATQVVVKDFERTAINACIGSVQEFINHHLTEDAVRMKFNCVPKGRKQE